MNNFQLIGCIGHFLRKNYRKSRNMSKRTIVNPIKKHLSRISKREKLETRISDIQCSACCHCFLKKRKVNTTFQHNSRPMMSTENNCEELMALDHRKNLLSWQPLQNKHSSIADLKRTNPPQSANHQVFHTHFHAYYRSSLSLDVRLFPCHNYTLIKLTSQRTTLKRERPLEPVLSLRR